MRFHEDTATSHTASETLDPLQEQFQEPIISQGRYINWPPKYSDLTHLDFFLYISRSPEKRQKIKVPTVSDLAGYI